jgi:restriction system protein
MNIRQAAIEILKDSDEPLHIKELTNRILEKKSCKIAGKTPHKTVTTQLNEDIRKNGDNSPFVRVAPGTYGLREDGSVSSLQAKKRPAHLEAKGSTNNTYSFTDAAEKVLKDFGDKQPMHYRVITQKALERGWLATQGKTPEATMYAQILTEIRRYQKRGEQSRFVQHGKGYVGLSRPLARDLTLEIEQHNRNVQQALRKRLLEMRPQEFEELIALLLPRMSFEEIEITDPSGDGGIDVRGTLVIGDVIRIRMAVQVKKWKRNIQAPVVQQVRGSLGSHEQGLIITTSDFSAGARKEAERPNAVPVALMNGKQLVVLLVENGICVTRHSLNLVDLEYKEVGTQ